MAKKELPSIAGKTFEDLKLSNEFGAEYWSARDLQPPLGYSQSRRFEEAIKRAISSCEQSGNRPDHHFAGAGKMVEVGKEVRDAIKRIGGDLPETIPAAEHIKEVEKRVKTIPPKLELDDKDAGGLLGGAKPKK